MIVFFTFFLRVLEQINVFYKEEFQVLIPILLMNFEKILQNFVLIRSAEIIIIFFWDMEDEVVAYFRISAHISRP